MNISSFKAFINLCSAVFKVYFIYRDIDTVLSWFSKIVLSFCVFYETVACIYIKHKRNVTRKKQIRKKESFLLSIISCEIVKRNARGMWGYAL